MSKINYYKQCFKQEAIDRLADVLDVVVEIAKFHPASIALAVAYVLSGVVLFFVL